ncbi:glycoside hydrolase family 3 N-terminal domain-containing protein [Lachnoclostridium sp.]|nr:glycoside hydrolase family 3 N-terminal domain-containing protein [Lachnoclostridium sp.]
MKNENIAKKISAKERAEELLAKMTLKEKIGQLNQRLFGFHVYERRGDDLVLTEELKQEVKKYSGLGMLYGLYRADPWSNRDKVTGLYKELAPKAYNMVQDYVIKHSRLSIPMMLSTECPHGHQALGGYLLPVNLATGATFNPDLLKAACKVCGMQLKEMGVDFALVSNLDILRDPRWGRSEECFSEDPYLASEMAKSTVEGIQETGVYVVAKHFCAQGEGTGGINASAARIGERELREIHLPAVKACCEIGVKGIMAAYNEIDGVFCHANKKLLTDILRKQMGFEGIVMSDGVAIDQLDVMTGDRVLSGAMALKAGVDIGLWDTGFSKLEEALELGYITIENINRSVLRILTMKYERGLFDEPYIPETNGYLSYHYDNFPQALELARESIILLKNEEQILPIQYQNIKSIGIIGPNADEIYNQLGDYTPPIEEEDGITTLKGIKEWIKENGLSIEVRYAKGCGILEGMEEEIEKAVEIANSVDLVIMVLGGSSSRFLGAEFDLNGAAVTGKEISSMDCGEGIDCADINLPLIQQKLAKAVFKAGKKVITIMIQGRPYAISTIAEKSSALITSFYGGVKAGEAIADILFGKISPSGHLPVSIPRCSGQIPAYYNYKKSYRAMGYYDIEQKPLYPFGYGLSYSTFQYSNIELKVNRRLCEKRCDAGKRQHIVKAEDLRKYGITIDVLVFNSGNYHSSTVILLYIKDNAASVVTRIKELKAFKKVQVLKNETRSCQLTLCEKDLSLWNQDMEFVLEEGEFQLILNDGINDIWEENLLVE